MDDQPEVLTVSQFTSELKFLLEDRYRSVWVSGEISNFRPNHSGHWYFSLKDSKAQIRAAVWKSQIGRIPFEVHDGLEVIAQGRISLYEPQGSYQLIVNRMQPKGMGPLELAFRQMRDKLERDGLFKPIHKKPLPSLPQRVALVTSPTGAAVRDMLQVMGRRWKDVQISIIPVRVQGSGAAEEIAAAIDKLNVWGNADVLIVGRGGGSLEDLWAFNEEIVARAIFASSIPVISAVGHEVDVTIADLVADRRALTPSEAAELAVPDEREVRESLSRTNGRLSRSLHHRLIAARNLLNHTAKRRAFLYPFDRIARLTQHCDLTSDRIARAIRNRLDQSESKLARAAAGLEGLSPLRVLSRGYSVTTTEAGDTVRRADELQVGDAIQTRLAHGTVLSRVEEVQQGQEESVD